MKNRRLGIATKVFIIVMILLIVSDLILGFSIYKYMKKTMKHEIKTNAMNLAGCAANSIDGEVFDSLRENGADSEEYKLVHDKLTIFLENGGVEYVYSIRQREGGGAEYVVDSDPEDPADMGEDFDEEAAEKEAFTGKSAVSDEITKDEWGEHLTAYSPIYKGNEVVGLVGVDLSASEISRMTWNIEKIILSICSAILVIGLVIIFILGRILRMNFSRLNDKVIELTLGNGDLTKKIEIHTGDEIETIAGNVNGLLSYMRNIMKTISSNSKEVQRISKKIAKDINETEKFSGEISGTIEGMSSSMQETAASMNEINERMLEITEAVDRMVGQIETGRKDTEKIESCARQTGADANERKRTVGEQVKEMKIKMQDKIDRSKAVEKINVLTENIINITSQTNLLSLNASIEAARAGDAGRGFAVVAHEIGQLAEDSAKAASEIRQISDEVVDSVNDLAKEAMEMLEVMGLTVLDGCEALVNESTGHVDSANTFYHMISDFSKIGEEIYNNTEMIKNSIGEIDLAIEHTAKGLCDIADRSVVMTGNMKDIENQADAGSEVSDALSVEVHKFRLE